MEQIWLQDLLQILDEGKIPDDGVAGQESTTISKRVLVEFLYVSKT